MQLMLILGIFFAIAAVLFAMQNFAPVTVTLAFWSFQGSLALVLLMSLGLGALIAGLISSPTVIRSQWAAKRLRRQVAELEHRVAELERSKAALTAEIETLRPTAASSKAEEKPYVGLRTLLSGDTPQQPR